MTAVLIAIALVTSSCAPFVSTSGEGAIQIFFGAPTGARALSDPPFSELPIFSAITIKVSGPGMDTVEFTVDATQTSFTAMVPGGSDRRVELYAPVDWTATTTLYPAYAALAPTLVKAYGATTTVDVVPGQRVTAVLRLEVAETKILLPDPNLNSYLYSAEDLIDLGPYAGDSLGTILTSDYEFDRVGRLLLMRAGGAPFISLSVDGFSINTINIMTLDATDLAFDRARNMLYAFNDITGSLYAANLDTVSPSAIPIDAPLGFFYNSGSIAVDSAGYVYVAGGTEGPEGSSCLLKLDVSSPSNAKIKSVENVEQLGLGYYDAGSFTSLTIEDMTAVDSKLYVALGKHVPFDHRGKIIEIDLETFTKTNEIGWSNVVLSSETSTEFYGPKRFIAIKPRRLVIADEGYVGGDRNRVVEIDLDTWGFSGTGLNDVVGFFEAYYC